MYTVKHMSATVTPAMRQYLDAKQQHRDAILLFRMGDFYEIFYEDALVDDTVVGNQRGASCARRRVEGKDSHLNGVELSAPR